MSWRSGRKRHANSELTLQVIVYRCEKLVSERDSINNVGSLTFPTVSAGIMLIACEILESLRERKEIQRFDWNQRICRKLQCFCPLDYPAWVRSWVGRELRVVTLANVLSPKNCLIRMSANRLLLSSTSNNGMSCLRLAEDRMQPFGIR
jgi:hypothetical protein